jgi:hypothetical protein
MPTVSEIGKFVSELPEDAQVVVVAQGKNGHTVFLRSDNLDARPGKPSWPRAVWQGMQEAGGTNEPKADA